MILPSLAVALTTLLNIASSQPTKRQNYSAAAAALLLNQALAYQVCIIASGGFAAVAAIQGTKISAPVCVAPNLPIPFNPNVVTNLMVSGCPNFTNYDATSGPARTGNTCTPQYLSSDGHLTPLDSSSQRTQFNFTIFSMNAACSGVRTPLTLSIGSANGTALSNTFSANTWNLNCTTAALTLSNSSLHLCVSSDMGLYSTSDPTCSTGYAITATTVLSK